MCGNIDYHFAQRFVLLISLLALQSKVKNKEVRCECLSGHSRNLDIYAGDESIQGVLLTVYSKNDVNGRPSRNSSTENFFDKVYY